ncbi:MAG: TraR/DksA family transcriptional regulator [Candidatus Brocadiia bacterium]
MPSKYANIPPSEYLPKIKHILLRRKAELIEEVEKRLHEAGAADAAGIDSIDAAMNGIEDEYTLNQISKSLELLDEIEDALKRIEKGEYGYCSGCGEAIELGRLKEVPSTRMCVKCRGKFEKESGKFPRVKE